MNFLSQMLSSSRDSGSFSSMTSTSGGDKREDGHVSFGYSLLRGKRPTMEDFYHAHFKRCPKSGELVGLFGVFDGHGGPHAADFVRQNIFTQLMQHSKFPQDLAASTIDAYEATDSLYLKQPDPGCREDGCTAVTAVIVGNRLLVANVGDSRAVLSKAGKAIAMSVDHKPNCKDERMRIENSGGCVVWAGTWRVGGVLAVSRAFGDKPLKRYVIATPDVREETLGPDDEFIILASDGLWDVVSNQDAVNLVRDVRDPEKAAKKLAEEAMSRGSNDNVSAIVVRFKH